MRNWVKTTLFITAFSPSLISVAVSRFLANGFAIDQAFYGLAGFFGTLCAFYIISILDWHGESFPFAAKKIESNDVLMLAFVGTYILPFFAKAAEITPRSTVILLFTAGLVLWFSSSIPTSPLMRMFGFRFYKAESANGMVFTVITRRELIDPSALKRVKKISSTMLMEVA